MSNLYDKWKESVITVYDSQELSTLELLEDVTSFNSEIAKGVDELDLKIDTEINNLNSQKTDLNGDHKGSWQGLSRPTLSEEGMRATVEKLNTDIPKLENDIATVNSQLEQKMNKNTNDIAVNQINKNLGKFDETYMSESLMAQIRGTAGVNQTIKSKSITTPKIAFDSINPRKTNFFNTSKNLINKNKLIANKSLSPTTGEPTDNATTSITEFIESFELSDYIGNAVARVCFYNDDLQFLSTFVPTTPSSKFTTPVNTSWIRISLYNSGLVDARLNLGSSLLVYEEFYEYINNDYLKLDYSQASNVEIFGSKDNTINFNTRKIIVGEGGGFTYQNYRIPLKSKEINFANGDNVQVLYYNPKTQEYTVKITSELVDGKILSKDNIALLLIDIPSQKITPNGNFKVISDSSVYNKPVCFSPINVPDIYNTPQSGLQTNGTGLGGFNTANPSATLYTDVYAKYDELVSLYPNYVNKTLLGKDSTGQYDIYKYVFTPSNPQQSATKNIIPKIIITTNTHGHEKLSVYSIYWLMQDICNNWKNDKTLEYLRWEVQFIIIPIVNPYGFVNNQRVNGNGVDINRNFDYKWEESVWNGNENPLYSDYKGIAPFSEKESQYIKLVLEQNRDAIFYADFHTNAGSLTSYQNLIWHVITNSDSTSIARYNIGFLTRKWQREFPDKVDQNMSYIGYSSKTDAPYISNYACKVLGILGMTPECWDRTPNFTQNSNEQNRLNLEFVVYTILNVLQHCKSKMMLIN